MSSSDYNYSIFKHFFHSLACKQLWFRTGVKDKLRFIPSHSMVESLGSDTCASLPCFHALTGCDSTSGLCGIGKKKAWMTLRKNVSLHSGIAKLGDEMPLPYDISKTCEAFLCALYTSAKCLKALQISCNTGCFVRKTNQVSPCHQQQIAFITTLKGVITKHWYGSGPWTQCKPYQRLLVTDGSCKVKTWKSS